jgi:hypothetical protein
MADAPTSAPKRRKRGGRPRKAEDERRGQFVGFWVTPGEFADLRTMAADTTVSAVMRAAVPGGPVRPIRTRRGKAVNVAPIVAQLGRLGGILRQYQVQAQYGALTDSLQRAIEDTLQELGAYLRRLAADDPET